MTEIDISPEAVARLCNVIACNFNIDRSRPHCTIDTLTALSAALTEAQAERDAALAEVARLREAMRDRTAEVWAAAVEAAGQVADRMHDDAMKWAKIYLANYDKFDGKTDSLAIAEAVRALTPPADIAEWEAANG